MNINDFNIWREAVSLALLMAEASYKRPLIMGILNVTPDSFSDGAKFHTKETALRQARAMIQAGADIIDIGGESSRPDAAFISTDEELSRVMPVIEALRQESDIVISIDTTKPLVMDYALNAGVNIINDINALQTEGAIDIAVKNAAHVVLMHRKGNTKTMQVDPQYPAGVVNAIHVFFEERIETCLLSGLRREQLILDPGFGFGKSVAHNLQLMRHFSDFSLHQLPLLIGVSRKSTLGSLLQKPVTERLIGSITMAVYALLNGALIVRSHDIEETKQAINILTAIWRVEDQDEEGIDD